MENSEIKIINETIIYIRTSSQEQQPKNQIRDCKILLNKKEKYQILEEKSSAWFGDRPVFNAIQKGIQNNKIKNLIIWDLDRLFRNRKKLIKFFDLCKIYKCQVNSFRQDWLNQLNQMPEPFNEIMFQMMLQIMGWISEEESSKKSERIKLAVRKQPGKITKSYKGNVWGRKPLFSKIQEQIRKLHKQGKTIREIQKKVYYFDKSNHKKFVSAGYVHKSLHNFNKEKT